VWRCRSCWSFLRRRRSQLRSGASRRQ
jgi:hypothetical protein